VCLRYKNFVYILLMFILPIFIQQIAENIYLPELTIAGVIITCRKEIGIIWVIGLAKQRKVN